MRFKPHDNKVFTIGGIGLLLSFISNATGEKWPFEFRHHTLFFTKINLYLVRTPAADKNLSSLT